MPAILRARHANFLIVTVRATAATQRHQVVARTPDLGHKKGPA
jgi:hypothetical protein